MTESGRETSARPVPRADASALRSGAGHDGEPLPRAEVFETHTAIVFFACDRAYKVKKPVDLGFLDYTLVAARRAACEREVAPNRRFAPDVYLGLGEFRSPDAKASEPVVVMRRVPADRRLSHLVREGAAVDDVLRTVARHLAGWHAAAPRGRDVDEQGTRDSLLSRGDAGLTQVRALAAEGVIPLPRHGPGTARRPGGRGIFPRPVQRVLRRSRAPSLWHDYVAYRAFVRAKVSLIQARQGPPGAAATARRPASTALHHLRTPAVSLTLVGGLPGSGKSTVSGALADRLEVTLLSSDRLRKELAGIPARYSAARRPHHRLTSRAGPQPRARCSVPVRRAAPAARHAPPTR
ncbi:hypothetical protein GCM10011579_081940 [Streptomyces albiflavescens]|uniref:Gluconate kinase n=1 Tax=Streptomyces albiflavescens TaxID=1623582 RepID=A0A917YF49_9ACTN|nr:hypothetical protein GCM10011579_081940 [Streptomyces albiflavescens]